MSLPLTQDPPAFLNRTRRAQEIVNELRASLAIDYPVQLAVVAHHPLVFSVQWFDQSHERFLLSMEVGFLLFLDDDELRAALAHELGHVWIYTHHPNLHTERLANQIGQRVIARRNFERLYQKLWKYEGSSGVEMTQILGPDVSGPEF